MNKSEYMKIYRNTYKGRKSKRVSDWKRAGILFHNYDTLYDIFMETDECDFCGCRLNTDYKTRKCCDHDHNIDDADNVRGILCHTCNIRDVYTTIDIYLAMKTKTKNEPDLLL